MNTPSSGTDVPNSRRADTPIDVARSRPATKTPSVVWRAKPSRSSTLATLPTTPVRVSVVIPTLNEAANLEHVLPRLPDGIHEVVLVDGGSTDGTCDTACRLRPDIRVICQTRKGKGNALACGFAACTGDIIVMLDADGSADSAEIVRFVDTLLAGADFAKGTRFATGGGSADITRLRSLGNRLLTGFVNVTCGTNYTDLCYGYNAFWAATCLPVLSLDWDSPPPAEGDQRLWGDGFEIETLINVRIAMAGLKVTEVPSYEKSRLYGVSNLNAANDGLRVLRTILTERHRAAAQAVRPPARPARRQVASHNPIANPTGLSLPAARAAEPVAAGLLAEPPAGAGQKTAPTPSLARVSAATANARQAASQGGYIDRLASSVDSYWSPDRAWDASEGNAEAWCRQSPGIVTDASVIICAYTERRWENVLAALESVHAQSVPPAEIILVIDHNERLLERARSLSGVTTVPNSKTPGASGSRDSGVAVASGSVAAFLDDDAVADPDWLELLLSGYVDPRVAGVGGSIIPEWPLERPAWFPTEFDWVVGCTYRGMPQNTGPVRNLIGANMSVRRDVLDGVGGFKEGYGNVKRQGDASWAGESRASSCEDTELCIRVSHTYPHLRWIYEPRARVRHYVPSHRATWRYYLSRSREEGLAKASLASAVGRESALGTEQSYASQTLPLGVARGLQEAVVHRDVDGLKRAGAILAGLSLTTVGFLEGRVRRAA